MPRPLKYAPLTEYLSALAQRGRDAHEMSFGQLDELVGGLPPSARALRVWWSNDSKTQARAWRAAGWHVETVSLDRERVRFALGVVGGTRDARLRRQSAAGEA